MSSKHSRRQFLKSGALTGSLFIIPGALTQLTQTLEAAPLPGENFAESGVNWFTTGGETVYHIKTGKTAAEITRSVFTATYSGKIICFSLSGSKLWERNAGNFFPFAIDVADIDGDGFDECAVASSDGSLYLIDHNGTLLHRIFTGKPPLYAVKIAADGSGNTAIYCGGPEKILYKISPTGQVLSQVTIPYAITNIDAGNFALTSGKGLVVGSHGNYARNYISFYNLSSLAIQGSVINTNATYLYCMMSADIDSDTSDRIVFGGNKSGAVFNSSGTKLLTLQEKNTGRGQDTYTMIMLAAIPKATGNEQQIIGLCGNVLRFYNTDGTIQKEVAMEIAPAAMHYDRVSGTLLFGSEISGGDTVYTVNMAVSGWENILKTLGYKGKIGQIAANINTLTAQISAFEAPPYQPETSTAQHSVFTYGPYNPGLTSEIDPNNTLVPLTNLYRNEFPYAHISFSGNQWLSENWDRSALPHGWDTKRDPRMTYKFTSQEIIDYAATLEQRGLAFSWTIGHGNDPFFLSLATVEGILLAAPNTCKGFLFPEMEAGDTPAFRYAVESHFKPICDLCLQHGKRKVFLRSKFLFWSADIYTSLWDWMLKDKKYRDVIVPCLEETYERVCDMSLAGRTGLKQGGWFSDWAGRAVHDNPCYDREHQWAATTIGSHFLRAMVYQAELGARYNLIQLGEAISTGWRGHSLVVKPYMHMLGKGILRCPQNPQDMLSLSPITMGMKPPSAEFISASHNSHQIALYNNEDPQWVFSRLQCFWGQAPTPAHDFGYYACGRKKQAMNFIPPTPYGLVPVHPDDGSAHQIPGVTGVIKTDGQYWYDENGNQRGAAEYASHIENTLKAAASSMFAQVTGEVAWTATRLDNAHTRLVLIDSGYLDPMDREVTVKFNTLVISARDILRKENLNLTGNSLQLTVPMGILRIIDIEHFPLSAKPTEPTKKNFTVYPNPFSDKLNVNPGDENERFDIQIFDMSGKILLKEKDKTILDLHHLEKGLYTIRITSGTTRILQKIMKI